MKTFYLMVVALLLSTATFAEQYCLNVAPKGSNKATLTIPFTENPSVSFAPMPGSQVLVISTETMGERTVVLDKTYTFFYTVDGTPTGISDAIVASGLKLDGNMAVVSGIKANSKVAVYASNGAQVASAVADANGVAVVDLSTAPSGVVIIKAGSESFKLIK